MSTANLSVGINTSRAKEALKELKAWARQEMSALAVTVDFDASTIEREINAKLKGKSFKIGVDTKSLVAEIDGALKRDFKLRLDKADLAAQVRAAVALGLEGAQLKLGAPDLKGSAPTLANTGLVRDVKQTISEILEPAVAELAKAAALVGSTARQASVEVDRARTRTTAARTSSVIDPTTGDRLSVRTALPDPAKALQEIRTARALDQMLPDRSLFEAALKERREMLIKSASTIPVETLLGLPTRDQTKSLSAQIAAQMRDGVQQELLKAKSATNIPVTTLLGLPTREETKAFSSQLAAQMRDSVASARLEMARFYESAKRDAQLTFKGLGPAIYAAQQTQAKFGAQATSEFLGTKVDLLGRVSDLDRYRKALEEAHPKVTHTADAHRALTHAMRDAHSAARGLAGSMGALWTTYGATVPLVAAAALGTVMRQVFVAGKDLEYQLTFVKVLSGETAVSLDKFGDAVRSSMLVSPREAAQAMRGLAQNGLTVREALQALPQVLALATAGEMSLADAAKSATGVMAAFGLSVADIGRIGDVFSKAAAISNTSVTGMTEAMKTASTVADQYKVTLEEAAAGLAVLAQRNIDGSAAGTAYRNMWVELATPTKKARDMMKELGLELYDSNHQLIEGGEALQRLHDRLSVLNEQSRLDAFNTLFGERGAKAANAIISNLDSYKAKLKEIREESTDFSQNVVKALSETTQGKLKSLFTEFELSTTQAFFQSGDAVKNFIDEMRQLVASKQFAEDVKTLTRAVVDLTKFVTDHAGTIAATLAIWKSAEWYAAARAGFVAIRAEMAATEVAAARLAVAGRAAWSALTGGLGLVIALGVEYLLLRDRTTEAEQAQLQYNHALEQEASRLQQSTKAMEDRVRLLQLQIQFQREGMSVEAARAAAEKADANRQVETYETRIKQAQARKAESERELRKLEQEIARWASSGAGVPTKDLDRQATLKRAIEDDTKTLNNLYTARNSAALNANAKSVEQEAAYQSKRLGQIGDFNRRLNEALSNNKKLKIGDLLIDEKSAPKAEAEFQAFLKAREAALNKGLVNMPKRDPAEEAQRRAEDLAESRALINRIKDEEGAMKQYIRFRKELDEARYNPDLYGQQISAALAEQREIVGTTELLNFQRAAVLRLQDAKKSANFKSQDRINIDSQIDNLNAEIKQTERLLYQQKELASIKSANAQRKEDATFQKTLAELTQADKARIDKQILDSRKPAGQPADEAAKAAAAPVRDDYLRAALPIQEKLNLLRQSEKLLEEEKVSILENYDRYDKQRLEQANQSIFKVQEAIAAETARLAVLMAQGKAAETVAGNVGRKLYNERQTAEFGWNKFWNDYVTNADSAATQVYNIMKRTTDGISSELARALATGKADFGSLLRSILADITKMMTDKAVHWFLDLMSGKGSSTPSASGGSGGLLSAGFQLLSTVFSAHGNVMTSSGPVALRRYRDGGVARSPQLSIFGDATVPEAYVPLQDGRTIPVTVEQRGEARSAPSIVYAPQISIDSRTDQAQVRTLVGDAVKQGNKELLQMLRDTGAIA